MIEVKATTLVSEIGFESDPAITEEVITAFVVDRSWLIHQHHLSLIKHMG